MDLKRKIFCTLDKPNRFLYWKMTDLLPFFVALPCMFLSFWFSMAILFGYLFVQKTLSDRNVPGHLQGYLYWNFPSYFFNRWNLPQSYNRIWYG